MDAVDADADAHADRSDAISEPVESETTEQQPGPSGPSILETLKAPRLSNFTRKRKVICNPPTGQRKARGSGASEPKSVNPRERVNEFPSAASERIFSLERNSFGERQNSSLQDYIEASLMLQYNNR